VLVGVLVVGLLDPAHHLSTPSLAYFVVGCGAYSLVITVLLTVQLLSRTVPVFTLAADSLALGILLYLSGGSEAPYYVFPLFPILVAIARFGWRPGLLVAGAFILLRLILAALTWQTEMGPAQLFPAALHVLLYLLVVAVVGVATAQRAGRTTAGWDRRASEQFSVPDRVTMAYEMAANLSATLNYERVLEAILDISRLGFDELGNRIGESVGVVLLYDQDGSLEPVSHRNLVVRRDEKRRVKGERGIVEQAIGSGEAVIGAAPWDDPELRAFQSLKPCKSTICVPLRAGFETYGVVLFASVKPKVYTFEHIELLSIFCSQATIALQNASLYQSLREERDKIIDKEEQARHKLARDLHDGPTQDVAAIAMRLNFARLLVERDSVRAKAELERLEDLAHRTVREIRSMLFTLRPIILETEGLVAALNQYADNLQESDGLPVTVEADRYEECLDLEAQGVVFAILEEAVNNARKHARASRVWVRLAVQGDTFVAQVQDNGRGFDVDAVESGYGSRGSLGMVNLRERSELVGGTLNIESTPGQGTRITLLVPISKDLI
jgi:signal transduction histidine kinase